MAMVRQYGLSALDGKDEFVSDGSVNRSNQGVCFGNGMPFSGVN